MSMWTSRRSGHVSNCLVLIASVLGCTSTCAGTAELNIQATPADIKAVEARITALVKGREDFPEEPVSSMKLEKPLRWSDAHGGRLIAPVTIRFKGLSNSYCRVATWMHEQADAVLVEVPQRANYDECRGFDTVRYLDINHDGVLDIVASVSVKSDSINGYVTEQAVFLSKKDSASGYCYSDSASRNLRSEYMQSEDRLRKALEQERKRLGVSQFECVTMR